LKSQQAVTSTNNTDDSAPSIAVVICTHNRPALLERCLQRLRQVENTALAVVVVDSAPTSSETKLVADRYDAEYEVSPIKGLSRARNIGACAIRADIIAYLDDDMLPHRHWLGSLIEPFADSDVMAVTGPMLALGLADASGADLRLAVELGPWGPDPFQIDRSSPQWFERTNFGGVGDGNFALRREAFDQIQGFDERLGRGATIDGGEEHYAYFSLVERGFKIAYVPQAIVFHPSSPRSRDVLRKQIVDTVAFSAFLAWNRPLQSGRIAKFLVEGIFRTRRWWRAAPRYEVSPLSTREKFGSGISGLSIFFRSVRQTPT
jgi:GT2 family glycosyltransferase